MTRPLLLAAGILLSAAGAGQTLPSFDAASSKENASGDEVLVIDSAEKASED
jgi:hypothetical protein